MSVINHQSFSRFFSSRPSALYTNLSQRLLDKSWCQPPKPRGYHNSQPASSITQFLDWHLTLCKSFWTWSRCLWECHQEFLRCAPLGLPHAPWWSRARMVCPHTPGCRSSTEQRGSVPAWPQLHAHQHQTCLDIPRNLSNTGIQTELPILLQCLKKAGKSLPLWHSSALPLCRAESALCTWAAGSSWARLGSWSPASCRRHSQSPWQSPQ